MLCIIWPEHFRHKYDSAIRVIHHRKRLAPFGTSHLLVYLLRLLRLEAICHAVAARFELGDDDELLGCALLESSTVGVGGVAAHTLDDDCALGRRRYGTIARVVLDGDALFVEVREIAQVALETLTVGELPAVV